MTLALASLTPGYCQTAGDLFHALGFRSVEGTMEVRHKPLPGGSKQIDSIITGIQESRKRRAAADEDYIAEVREAENKEQDSKIRHDLEKGSIEKYKFIIQVGADNLLGVIVDVSGKLDTGNRQLRQWILQTPTECIIYDEFNASVSIVPGGLAQSSRLGIIYDNLGCFGQTSICNLLEKSSKSKMLVDKLKSTVKLPYGETTVQFVDETKTAVANVASTVDLKDQNYFLSDKFKFSSLDSANSRSFPRLIEREYSSSSQAQDVTIQLTDISLAGVAEALPSLGLPPFGKVTVTDNRLNPEISYPAIGSLPPAKQVAEFVNDPKALDDYVKSLRVSR